MSGWYFLHLLAARYTGGSMAAALGLVLLFPLAIFAAGIMFGAVVFRRPRSARPATASATPATGAGDSRMGITPGVASFMAAGVIGLTLWMVLWLLLPWPAMQDGALGYVRAAQDLGIRGTLAGSGIDFSAGRWSLLYLLVLTAMHPLFDSMLVPRILSSIGYAALVARLLLGMGPRARRGGLPSLLLFALLLLVLATPAAIYVLDDGCSAAWSMLAAAAMVFELRRLAREGSRSVWPMAAWSGFAVLLRPEMLLASAAASLAMYFWPEDRRGMERRKVNRAPAHIPVLAGMAGFVLLACVSLILGAGFPLHLTVQAHLWAAAILSGVRSLEECRAFGWGLLVVWGISWIGALLGSRRRRATLAINVIVPVLVAGLALRGENIAFAGEIAWALLMASLWNTVELGAAARDAGRLRVPLLPLGGACAVAALLLLAVQVVEVPLFLRAEKYRGQEVYDFRDGDMGELRGYRAVAVDAGFFAYFTQAAVCNPGELVAGRFPSSGYHDRVEGCAETKPQFGFLTVGQAQTLSQQMDVSSWSICQAYGIPHLLRHDSHLLITSKELADHVCEASNGFAVPLDSVVHGRAEMAGSIP